MKMIENRIKQLRTMIDEYNQAYYLKDNPKVTDFEYDALMNELNMLEA